MRFYRIYIEMSHLGHNVIKRPFKWKSKRVRTSLTSTIEILSEEVELSNTRTASVMHIPNTLSLTSARNGRKQKFQKILISNWPRTRKFSQFFKNTCGEDIFLPWSRVGHALRPIFMLWLVKIWQVSSCGKFMQHLESCLLWQLKLTEFCVNLWCF